LIKPENSSKEKLKTPKNKKLFLSHFARASPDGNNAESDMMQKLPGAMDQMMRMRE
jgi:hypothetical protein